MVLAVLLVAAGAWFFGMPEKPSGVTAPLLQDDVSTLPPEVPTDSATAPVAPVVQTFSMAEVSLHNTPEDCYAAIRGEIYNVTAWITAHPGGEKAILGLCGKDGTSAFEQKHAGQPGPEEALKGFKIGELTR